MGAGVEPCGWGHIRCCGCCRWRFRSYSESLFQTPKRNQKALPRRSAHSLGLGVPSLRDRSGRSVSGLLRCTSFRCVRLRRKVAALPRPDQSRNEACRRGERSRAKAKQKQKPDQQPLTLTLSRRERGLTEAFGRNTPTCDTESNADSEKPANRLPLPRERAGVRGESHTDPKQTTRFSPLNNER
jgi:hypothetical protein